LPDISLVVVSGVRLEWIITEKKGRVSGYLQFAAQKRAVGPFSKTLSSGKRMETPTRIPL
jgi:hypothetical protein